MHWSCICLSRSRISPLDRGIHPPSLPEAAPDNPSQTEIKLNCVNANSCFFRNIETQICKFAEKISDLLALLDILLRDLHAVGGEQMEEEFGLL